MTTRRAIVQARFNEGPTTLMTFQLMALAGLAGWATGSWWGFLVGFVVLMIGIHSSVFATTLVLLLSVFWAIIIGAIAHELWGWIEAVPVGLLGFLVALGANRAGLQGLHDRV